MARISIADEKRQISDPAEVTAFLAGHGITYEQWEVGSRVGADASADQILAAYAPEVERLKQAGGYVTADVIDVTPQTPNLDAMLARFSTEHTHSEDEVRFIVKGNGIFHVHPPVGPVFALEVEAGDLINVPAGTQHWFDLCADRVIRAIRLFRDKSGWTPNYIAGDLHARYEPVCWGPSYVASAPASLAAGALKPVRL